MEVNNFNQTLNAFKNRRPYRPFTVVLVNGDRFEVDFPNALVVRDGMAVYIAAGGAPILFDYEGVSQFIGDLLGQTDTKDQASPI
jgi:hypothetical protein